MSVSNAHVRWAQRKAALYITVEVVDATNVRVDFVDNTVRVSGFGICKVGAEAGPFNVLLKLAGELGQSGHSFRVLGQGIQIHAAKASTGHWSKLTVEAPKVLKNWLACDWTLWKDEDEEDAAERLDFGGGGYGDVGNMFNGVNASADSDDEDEPLERPPADLSDLGV